MNDRAATCPLSQRVVAEVADELDTDPTELEPLYHSIDPDALDTLFADRSTAADGGVVKLTFTYAGYRIVVGPDRSVEITSTT